MFADSHAHLSMPAFEEDLPGLIIRARAAGVDRVMTCATSMADAPRNLAIAREHALKASVGFHPHQAKQWEERSEDDLRGLVAAWPEIAAIGEIGLDFHYDFSPRETQVEVLRRQLRIARSLRLPVIVHCRNARDEIRRIFLEEGAGQTGGVLHCFSEDVAFARFCVESGFHVSFSGIVTFKNASSIRAAAAEVPLDRLLVETDAPFLAPVPHRGRRNEPMLVVDVARFVAGLRSVPVETIAAATSTNFDRLFGSPAAA